MSDERTSRNEPWREDLRAMYTAKQRTAIPRVRMPELTPEYAVTVDDEVLQGLSVEQAVLEARRCLDCPDPGCIKGCPVHNDIPGFIKNIERREFGTALRVIRRTSVLPAVCGRVCPQEKQCEANCTYTKMKRPAVAIGNLERFVADNERLNHPEASAEKIALSPLSVKVAVVGSGPSGLAFAGDMARRGFRVTVFEAMSWFGGVLKSGIPRFCLPKYVVNYEIERLRALGVELVSNCHVGRDISYEDLLRDGYKGIYVATGAGKPRMMGIPGEDLPQVLSAQDYLACVNQAYCPAVSFDVKDLNGKTVAVIGGGNTAMDAVRAAIRGGASRALIIYRRGEEEMPARLEEVRHARLEGTEFMCLRNPVEYVAGDDGALRAMRLQVMELSEPDATGRRSPVPVEGAIEEVPVDMVVVAVGFLPNPPKTFPNELEMSRHGRIMVDEDSLKSSASAIYAGGDIVRGPATVILAMGDGRRAADSMTEAFRRSIEETTLL